MLLRRALVVAATLGVALVGCSREQAWTYQNGIDLGDAPPAQIVAEVYEGRECGAGCRPPGALVDCFMAPGVAPGRAPTNMRDGDEYCFVVTALDEAAAPYAIGCEGVRVGSGEPVALILSSADGPGLPASCGLVAGLDAGPPTDGGVAGDAGTDAGPSIPLGSSAPVTFTVQGPGLMRLVNLDTGQLVPREGPAFEGYPPIRYETFVGRNLALELTPDPGFALTGLDGVDCEPAPDCVFVVAGPTVIDVSFGVP